MELTERPTTLYRAFDADGTLLYIGVAVDWGHRWSQHRLRSPWFAQVARIELEEHHDRPAALAAEARAIVEEKPRHNLAHTDRDPRRGWYARARGKAPGAPEWDHRALLTSPEYLAVRQAIAAFTKARVEAELAEVLADLAGAAWYLDGCRTCTAVLLPTVTTPDRTPGAQSGWFRAHYFCEACGTRWAVGWSSEIQTIGVG